MKTKIKFLGLALIGLLILSTSCKKTEDSIEETLGELFTVQVDGSNAWDSNTANATIVAKMENSKLKITLKNGGKEVVLYAEKFEKEKFTFDDTVNSGTYKEDGITYASSESINNYIEITNIHSDGKKFDAKFNFTGFNGAADSKVTSGTWANVTRLQ